MGTEAKSGRALPKFTNDPVGGRFIRCIVVQDIPEDQQEPLMKWLGKTFPAPNEDILVPYSEYNKWYNSWHGNGLDFAGPE